MQNVCFYIYKLFLFQSESSSVTSDSATPMDCSPPGFSVHGILQIRILEWVAVPFSTGSSPPRFQTRVSCTAGRFFTIRATRHPLFFLPSSIGYNSQITYREICPLLRDRETLGQCFPFQVMVSRTE